MLERTPIRGVAVYEDGASLDIGAQGGVPTSVHARLVVDCMGRPTLWRGKWARLGAAGAAQAAG